LCLQSKQHHLRIRIHTEIKARTIAHARRDIELPITGFRIFTLWPIPSFVSRKCRARCEKPYLSEEWEVDHRSVRVSCEEECRRRDRLLRGLESSEEKLETIRIMQEDHIEVIMHVVECIDILIEDDISLFFWHLMKVLCECVNTMYTETFVIDKNLLCMTYFCQEMHLHLVLEPGTSVDEVSIVIVVVTNNSKMSESFKTVKEFFCDLDEVFK
jgi:hypothetical protein